MCTAEKTTIDWLTTRECIALLQCTRSAFQMMVVNRLIRKREAGGYRRYWREDVERLASPPDHAA